MWLLTVETKQLKYIANDRDIFGKYAIVSHTWADGEVTFQDIRKRSAEKKKGYAKVQWACSQAVKDGLSYIWIDTACIDKTSSAELSEAINSMFRWYQHAKICYAYLPDVPKGHKKTHFNPAKDVAEYWAETRKVLSTCRWFTRGWTLQELVAPEKLEFYDAGWKSIGNKAEMVEILSDITGIDAGVLRNRDTLHTCSVATRMSWAAHRHTLRPEDRAYSLLGIFDVHIPLLYGEGEKAFLRLQEEIMSVSLDHSILAWEPWQGSPSGVLLSPSPYGFRNAGGILSWSYPEIDESFALSNKGLRITLPTLKRGDDLIAVLNCRYRDGFLKPIALHLHKNPKRHVIPRREVVSTVCHLSPVANRLTGERSHLKVIDEQTLHGTQWCDLVILRHLPTSIPGLKDSGWEQKVLIHKPPINFVQVSDAFPVEQWDGRNSIMTLLMTGEPQLQLSRAYIVLDGLSPFRVMLAFENRTATNESHFNLCLSTLDHLQDPSIVANNYLDLSANLLNAELGIGNGRRLLAGAEHQLLMGELVWQIKISIA